MSTFQDQPETSAPASVNATVKAEKGVNEGLTPKPIVTRRRPAGVKPAVEPARREYFQASEPRPRTAHDRYLTYDSKGKLITHTVYHAPPLTKPVVLVFPKRKINKA